MPGGCRPVEKEEAERAKVGRVEADVLGRFEVGDEQLDDEVAQAELHLLDRASPPAASSVFVHIQEYLTCISYRQSREARTS